ncbi:MAG: hypothetical protein ABF545_00490 [Bifidobacterium psychraerophilum]|uniref:hypothetical protein n=1 Tax=Bifidobacterium psychraerophilum TaxID=218140 RepID=UPI0039ED77D4
MNPYDAWCAEAADVARLGSVVCDSLEMAADSACLRSQPDAAWMGHASVGP